MLLDYNIHDEKVCIQYHRILQINQNLIRGCYQDSKLLGLSYFIIYLDASLKMDGDSILYSYEVFLEFYYLCKYLFARLQLLMLI